MKSFCKSIFLGFFPLLLIYSPLLGESAIELELEREGERYNLGISPFFVEGRGTPKEQGINFRQIVRDDLAFSKLFNLVEEGPAVKKSKDAAQWAPVGSDIVLVGTARNRSKDRLQFTATLYDVKALKSVLEIKKKGTQENARELAHLVSDEIVQYFTGKPGIFSRKIAFINDATGRKELYFSDYDGKNIKRVTNDNSIVILPRISQDGENIIFTSYRSGNPDLYIMNHDGTGRRKISGKSGLNVSPSWSPAGDVFALTLSINESPNIYLMDLNGQVKERLTRSQGADTAPDFSPEGNQIVFTSDRAGSPHIYVMNLDGTGLRRLTTVGHCDSAAWSPDGETIVYVKGGNGSKFDIYSIEVLTGIERRLTWGEGDNENPAWSPDGRFIIFISTRGGKPELYVMNRLGGNQRRLINMKGKTFTPHWGS
jgi:TolB protein